MEEEKEDQDSEGITEGIPAAEEDSSKEEPEAAESEPADEETAEEDSSDEEPEAAESEPADEETAEEDSSDEEPEAAESEPADEETAEEAAEEDSSDEEPEAAESEPADEASEEESTKKSDKGDSEEPTSGQVDETAETPAKKKEETAEDLLKSELAEVKIRRAKRSKNITNGIVHITATFNNTKVNITDMRGNTISWSSSGKCNFRGSRKSTAYAAQVVTMDAGRAAMAHRLKEVVIKVCGPGMGRDSAVRALQSLGLNVSSIIDVTPVPHNGCRPPKRRRV
jgi:small subunit ribosomal protein S11